MTDETDPFADKPAEDPKPLQAEPATRKVRAKAEEAPRLHAILSNDEVARARAKARERIEGERKLAALRAVEDEEVNRLRVEEGLTTGDSAMDELVDITINLPPYTPNILINGGTHRSVYWHGVTYHGVPRHIYDTLMEQMWRCENQEQQVDGKSLADRMRRKRDTRLNANTGAVFNAPRRADA